MSDAIRVTEHAAARQCPRCAEAVVPDARECGFCDQPIAPRRSAATRLVEVASLAAALAVIVIVCRLMGRLIGI